MTRPSRESGSASTILLVAIVIVVVMFATTLTQSGTTAVATEQLRYDRERAALAAKNALVDADVWMESEIVPAIEDVLRQAAAAKTSFAGPNLMSVEFPTYERRFAMSGAGSSEDEYADVTATVMLAGPPMVRSLAGVSGEAAPVRTEEYRFVVRMIAEGHAAGDAIVRYEHTSQVLVELEIGPAF